MLLITIQPITLITVYYSTFLCDFILYLRDHQEASDGIAPLKVDLDAYLTKTVLETFAKFLGISYSHMDVTVLVIVGGGGVGIAIVTGTARFHLICRPKEGGLYMPN